MVSMRKMVQSGRWLLQLILLCLLWELGSILHRSHEHSSLGIHQAGIVSEEDLGEIVFFVLYVVVSEILKRLDSGYRCPLYCEVKHKHIYAKKKSHIQGVDRVPRPDELEDREQPESDIRPIASI